MARRSEAFDICDLTFVALSIVVGCGGVEANAGTTQPDVGCAVAEDCEALGSAFVCVDGACTERTSESDASTGGAGAHDGEGGAGGGGSSATIGGTSGAGGAPVAVCPDPPPPTCEKPFVSPNSVAFCSDSEALVTELRGPIIEQGLGMRCDPGTTLGCEHSFIVIDAGGVAATVGFCIPGGFQPPPLGTVVSVGPEQPRWANDDCPGYWDEMILRDESGALLLYAISGFPFTLPDTACSGCNPPVLPELGAVKRLPDCNGTGAEDFDSYYRYEALQFTLGSETARVGSGETLELGGYVISAYAVRTVVWCAGSDDCPPERDLVVVQPR